MAAQKGKDLLLKVDDGGGGGFITVAGLRARQIAFNTETVDVTDSESAGRWRELLSGAGLRRASVTGSGLFKDQQSDETIRSNFFSDTLLDWQIIVPDFGTVTGKFQITALEYSGQHNAELAFEISLESAGEITFTASA